MRYHKINISVGDDFQWGLDGILNSAPSIRGGLP